MVYKSRDKLYGPAWTEKFLNEGVDSAATVIVMKHGNKAASVFSDGGAFHVFYHPDADTAEYIGQRYSIGPAFEIAANVLGLYLWGQR